GVLPPAMPATCVLARPFAHRIPRTVEYSVVDIGCSGMFGEQGPGNGAEGTAGFGGELWR
ncbi:MAG: hypothetical protein WAK82_08285, partial [Streptosporangiaceae bacterium]